MTKDNKKSELFCDSDYFGPPSRDPNLLLARLESQLKEAKDLLNDVSNRMMMAYQDREPDASEYWDERACEMEGVIEEIHEKITRLHNLTPT